MGSRKDPVCPSNGLQQLNITVMNAVIGKTQYTTEASGRKS